MQYVRCHIDVSANQRANAWLVRSRVVTWELKGRTKDPRRFAGISSAWAWKSRTMWSRGSSIEQRQVCPGRHEAQARRPFIEGQKDILSHKCDEFVEEQRRIEGMSDELELE